MAIVFNGTSLTWYEHTIVLDGTTVSEPSNAGTVVFDGTTVHGLTGTSFTTLKSFGLAPDSLNLENAVADMIANHSAAFSSYYYQSGLPSYDNRWYYTLNPGYRMVTSDGTFTGGGNYLWEGLTVTGANTSHNGGTSCQLQRDNGV